MFLLLSALSFACSQGEGDPCQSKADCSDGMQCCAAKSAARGTCTKDKMCPTEEAGRGGSSSAGRGGSGDDAGEMMSNMDAGADSGESM
jgi:hypothetical protein